MKAESIMIEARPTGWARNLFRIYLRNLLKKHFHAIYLSGNLPQTDPYYPILMLPNHSTWWDGFLFFFLNDLLFKRPINLMMLERQLTKFMFFTRLGAYSVNPEYPQKTLESLRYSLKMLHQNTFPRPMLCLFPQGELLPWAKRPLDFKPGVEWLLRHYDEPVQVLPLGIRIEFTGEQRPDIFFRFGDNLLCDKNHFPSLTDLENMESDLLNELADQINQDEKGRMIWRGRKSASEATKKFRLWRGEEKPNREGESHVL